MITLNAGRSQVTVQKVQHQNSRIDSLSDNKGVDTQSSIQLTRSKYDL